MKAENSVWLVDVWVGVRDPRPAKKVEHPLVEWLIVAVFAALDPDAFGAAFLRRGGQVIRLPCLLLAPDYPCLETVICSGAVVGS